MQGGVTYIYDSTTPTLVGLDTGGQWKPLSFVGSATIYAVITDSNGLVTNYTSCGSSTTTSTTTTTTTPSSTTTTSTTTTTTTAAVAFIEISNDTSATSITNITINGVQVDNVVFPIIRGRFETATTTQTGASRTIVVSYTNISGDSVDIMDTSSNVTCLSATSTSRTFSAQAVAAGGTLYITMLDGSC
jgi:hypothetical protein